MIVGSTRAAFIKKAGIQSGYSPFSLQFARYAVGMKKGMFLIALLPLAGCGGEPSNRTAGGVTPDEARALDEAAEMVEARQLPVEALRPPAAATQASEPASAPSDNGPTGEPKQ